MSHSSITTFSLKRDRSVPQVGTRFVQALMITAGLVVSSSLTAASATQVGSDQFVFDRAPRLVGVSATQSIASANDGAYQFTLRVPKDSPFA